MDHLYVAIFLFSTAFCLNSRLAQFDLLKNKDLDSKFLLTSFTRLSRSHCLLLCLHNGDCLSIVIGPKLYCRLFAKDPRSLLDNNDLILRNRSLSNLYLASNAGFQCFRNGIFHNDVSLCDMEGKRVNSNCSDWSKRGSHWTYICHSQLIFGESRHRDCTRPLNGGFDCIGGDKTEFWSKVPKRIDNFEYPDPRMAEQKCRQYKLELFSGLHYVLDGRWAKGLFPYFPPKNLIET